MRIIKLCYFTNYNWLIKNKIFKNPEEPQEVHRLLSAVSLTALLMWSYAFNAYFCIPSPLLVKIGFLSATLHILSPLIYKLTGSVKLTTYFFIGVGFSFQFSHSFFTGGFLSNTIIWLSILPLIAAIIIGRFALIFWSIIAVLSVAALYFLNDYTVNIISDFGKVWAQLNIAIGYILVNFVLMFLFIFFKDWNSKILSQKNESIKKLLRIVSHDIANPLMIILGKNTMLKRTLKKEINEETLITLEKHCDSIDKSSIMIKDILDHTRTLDIINIGNNNLNITSVALNEIVENSLFVFRDRLDNKKIIVDYDFKKNADISINAESISIKNQVFNNLFSNSIKFMDIEGNIKIKVNRSEEYTEVTYSDSGIGMEPDIVKNLFRTDIKTTKKGVHGEEGTGFGMPILYSTLLEIGASIHVRSYPKTNFNTDHGTIFELKFVR